MELDQSYVWISTRRLKPGTREEFSRAWRPRGFPDGMLRAYECYAPEENEVVGISRRNGAKRWRPSCSRRAPASTLGAN